VLETYIFLWYRSISLFSDYSKEHSDFAVDYLSSLAALAITSSCLPSQFLYLMFFKSSFSSIYINTIFNTWTMRNSDFRNKNISVILRLNTMVNLLWEYIGISHRLSRMIMQYKVKLDLFSIELSDSYKVLLVLVVCSNFNWSCSSL